MKVEQRKMRRDSILASRPFCGKSECQEWKGKLKNFPERHHQVQRTESDPARKENRKKEGRGANRPSSLGRPQRPGGGEKKNRK